MWRHFIIAPLTILAYILPHILRNIAYHAEHYCITGNVLASENIMKREKCMDICVLYKLRINCLSWCGVQMKYCDLRCRSCFDCFGVGLNVLLLLEREFLWLLWCNFRWSLASIFSVLQCRTMTLDSFYVRLQLHNKTSPILNINGFGALFPPYC